jgi:Indole-3-glycerol phosphate synthase
VTVNRRLSQAISEGDGISILVEVGDRDSARSAEDQGAEGLVVRGVAVGVREETGLPLLWYGHALREAQDVGVDAIVLTGAGDSEQLIERVEEANELGLECVVLVSDEDDLERVLEQIDPEILLLTASLRHDDAGPLEQLLDLLPDIPAGKLAIAELRGATRDDVEELERAGVDAVLVSGSDIGSLVGDAPPRV